MGKKENLVSTVTGALTDNLKNLPKAIFQAPKKMYDSAIGRTIVDSKETGKDLLNTAKNVKDVGKNLFTTVKSLGGELFGSAKSAVKGIGSTIKNIGSSLFGKKKRAKGEISDVAISPIEVQKKVLELAGVSVPIVLEATGSEEAKEAILKEIGEPIVGTILGSTPVVEAEVIDEASRAVSSKGTTSANTVEYNEFTDKKRTNFYPGTSYLGHDEKNDCPASITVKYDSNEFVLDNFFLESIQFSRSERMSTMPMLNGDNIFYFYGKNPTTASINCICLDMNNQEWLYDMEYYYEHILRATRSVYGQIKVTLNYDNKSITGYITSMGSVKSSASINTANLQFSMLVTNEEYFNYTEPDTRWNSEVGRKAATYTDIKPQALSSILKRISDRMGGSSVTFEVSKTEVSR